MGNVPINISQSNIFLQDFINIVRLLFATVSINGLTYSCL